MSPKASITASRSVLVGIRPMIEMPASLRSTSAEKRGGAMPDWASTSISSMTRAASTTVPAVDRARKRTASVGAIPARVTCKPSACTSAHVMPCASSASRTPISEVSSISCTEKLAATRETTAAAAKVRAIVKMAERRMGGLLIVKLAT